jgi:hypothetical protein
MGSFPAQRFSGGVRFWERNGSGGRLAGSARRGSQTRPLADLGRRHTTAAFCGAVINPGRASQPRPVTGWARIDEELAELCRHFQIACSEQDYRNVGNDCVIVAEALSRQVYDPDVHLRQSEDEPPPAKTKIRIERYIEDTAPGPDNADLRKLARAAIEFAQRVKHSATSSRREAGIAADTVILLANILRRLEEPE